MNRPRGRPKKELDARMIRELAGLGVSNEQIARILKCSRSTLETNYQADIKSGRDDGEMNLRRRMLRAAMDGSIPMMIWLSKNLLGMRDHPPDDPERDIPMPWD
jgi:hypothetical protein